MKTEVRFFLITFILVSLTSGVKSQSLVDYNNVVLNHYTLLDNALADYNAAIFDEKVTYKELKKKFDLLNKIVKYQGEIVRSLNRHYQDDYFLYAVKDFYSVTQSTLENEFQEIMDLYAMTWEESYGKKISDLDSKAVKKIVDAENKVIEAQKKFAEKNGLNLN